MARRTTSGLVNGVLLVGVLYMVLPLLYLLISATKNLQDLYSTSPFTLTDFALWHNITQVFAKDDGIYVRWLFNSVLYATLASVVGGFLCVLAGYAFDKFEFPGKERWYSFVLVGVMVPVTALTLPLYLLASKTGLVNTVWAVLIPFLVNPFGVYLARTFSQGYVNNSTLEAARIDGASEFRAFFSVGLPMMVPGFVTIGLFQFVGVWNNFMLPLVMFSDPDLYPVSLGIYGWNMQAAGFPTYYPLVFTGSLLSLVPLLIAFVFLQRFWRAGLTVGSEK